MEHNFGVSVSALNEQNVLKKINTRGRGEGGVLCMNEYVKYGKWFRRRSLSFDNNYNERQLMTPHTKLTFNV